MTKRHGRVAGPRPYSRPALMTLAVILVAGCTSIQVTPVPRMDVPPQVCIEENPKVIVEDFLPVVRDGFSRHGILTEVVSAPAPERCEYVLTYTALQSWDFATYLSVAQLTLARRGQTIATADYHLIGKGGFSLMKWQGTKTKMDPVLEQLLQNY